MSAELPEHISPFQLADQGTSLVGTLPLSRLLRLHANLNLTEGNIRVDLDFKRDEYSNRSVTGSISTKLQVICQRCLTPMHLDLRHDVRLELVRDPSAESSLPSEFEPFQVVSEPISLVDMIEDELILALPIAPTHRSDECLATGLMTEDGDQDSSSPFSILSGLKLRNRRQTRKGDLE